MPLSYQVSRARAAFSGCLPSPTLFSCALPFRRRCIYIWADPARFARPWECTTRARSFPRFYSRCPLRRVLLHLCGERRLSFVGEMSLPPPYEHHHVLAYTPSSPIDLRYPRPALIAARLDLPIRTLLLRVVVSPVYSAPRLRMRSPYPRTCTVYVRIPIRIPLRLPKHQLRNKKIWVRMLMRAPRQGSRRAPVLLVVPGLPRAKIQVRTSAPKHMRSAGYQDL
ncbi:hypothetical protein B0H13DRAFT_2313560 [Mycena leptocephala]|nr:hypothetical protein B0H13DRAFT_2313560 [Mycena leptocephala]